ncbi:MAG: glycoside hydrolase [Euryarchaeota archaeon]|nr:glycoside hydrolase [Euryarchaeota archaeon]
MRVVLLVLMLALSTVLAGCVSDDRVTDDTDEALLDPLVPEGLARHLPVPSFEPTIGITSSGAMFMTAGAGGRGPDMESVYRSTDQGRTWEDVTPNIAGATNFPPNSNDPFLFVDRDTDRLYDFEMQGLSCNTLSYSDDEGKTWTIMPLGCTPTQGLQDHQSIFASKPRAHDTIGYDNVLHYCVNRVADSACAFSLDGGLTWGPMRPLVYDGVHDDRLASPPLPTEGVDPLWFVCSGLAAHGQSAPDGTIYLPRGDCGGIPTVAISKDDGLTWTHSIISTEVRTFNADGGVPYHEVSMAIDEAGNAYATWKGEDRRVKFAQSLDGGESWEDAIDITPEGVNITDFPTIAAGSEGRVAVAFIGTDAHNNKTYGEMEIDDDWHAWLVVGTELHTANATWYDVQTTPADDPIARGICGGTRCQASGGGLGDFIDIEIDAEGRPWAAFVDVCHDDCRAAQWIPEGSNTVNDKALAFVGTLRAGPALRGELVALPVIVDGAIEDTTA